MLDLSACSILDIYGVKRLPLAGEYSAETLTAVMIENWIPYMECHKCGKSSYCMYALPHPRNEYKKQEIQCGVAVEVLRNFVAKTVHIAEGLGHEETQSYLDGAFFLTRFVLEAEQSVGTVVNSAFLNYWGDFAPGIFGHLTRIRDTLNSLSQSLRQIPAFKSERSILLVEGWAEKAFFEKMRESHSAWFLDLIVECYDGQGNRRSKRIAMLLEKYNELGYSIYAQGDADGKAGDIFKGLVDSGHIKPENAFVFEHDFESAVPLPLLVRAIRQIGLPISFKPTMLRDELLRTPQPVGKALLSLGTDIGPYKVALAVALAELLNHPFFAWWNDDRFTKSELGRFLEFVQRMP